MIHYMKLKPEPFERIASGKKSIELRLYDEKRKQVKPKDIIVFSNTQYPNHTVSVIVDSFILAPNFESLFNQISLVECGYDKNKINGKNYLDMEQYYSKEEQELYGVVGIRFTLNTEERSYGYKDLSLDDYLMVIDKCSDRIKNILQTRYEELEDLRDAINDRYPFEDVFLKQAEVDDEEALLRALRIHLEKATAELIDKRKTEYEEAQRLV